MPRFYITPKQDDFNKIPERQVCIAEALYDVSSVVADPGTYTKEEYRPCAFNQFDEKRRFDCASS